MRQTPSLNGSKQERKSKEPVVEVSRCSEEEWDRLSPWWPHVRRLSGPYFWVALAVIVSLAIVAGYCTWHCIQPTTVAGEVLVLLGLLVFWGATVIAFTGWALRRESRRADVRAQQVTEKHQKESNHA